MTALRLICLSLMTGLLSCHSGGEAEVPFPCICGTPEAAMESCLHGPCADGKNNVENPDCVCGTLSFGKED